MQQYNLEVDLDDITSFDEKLRDLVLKQPADYLPLFEDGAKEVSFIRQKKKIQIKLALRNSLLFQVVIIRFTLLRFIGN